MKATSTGGRQLVHAALAARELVLDEPEVTRKELGAAARDAMKAMMLRPSLRLVLGEIVGCWGEKMIGDRILVWPSNEYLIQRTGLSERSVRYAISALVRESLVVPKDSANGKRFAIKGAGGAVLDAYGFDLTPLYARRAEWTQRVEAQRDVRNARRRLFDEITVCRRSAEEALLATTKTYPGVDRGDVERELEELIGRTPRRNGSADLAALGDLLEAYRGLRKKAEYLFYIAGNGGKDCRLIESSTHPNIQDCSNGLPMEVGGDVEVYSSNAEPVSLKLILEACPSIETYYGPVTSERALIEAGRQLRAVIGAHPTAWLEAVDRIGALDAAILVCLTLQIHENDQAGGTRRIANPGGYFRQLSRLLAEGRVNLPMELMTLRRKRLEAPG